MRRFRSGSTPAGILVFLAHNALIPPLSAERANTAFTGFG
jgi:hypothetical protein